MYVRRTSKAFKIFLIASLKVVARQSFGSCNYIQVFTILAQASKKVSMLMVPRTNKTELFRAFFASAQPLLIK
jgi:hypothetical protein